MKKLTLKETTLGSLMGVSGFLAIVSLILLIYYFTKITSETYPIKYVAPTFIISLIVWLYCLYTARALKKA
jgi:uncharacterized membrane protein